MSAGSGTRPGRSNKDERRSLRLGVALLAVAVAVSTTVALIAWQLNSGERGPGGVLGPYVLTNSSRSVSLEFPECAVVTTNWRAVTGVAANFSVWPPPLRVSSTCTGPAPTNSTCPQSGCDPYEGPPVCYETGQGGSCSFTSTQTGYEFDLYSACSPTSCPSLGGLTVSFTASDT
jgi:hypothetical protein